MQELGWLSQPAVFPWVALAVGLCIGSFLNVVIHRLPRMMDREWLRNVPEILEESKELRDRDAAARLARGVRDQIRHFEQERFNLLVPRSRCPACGQRISALQNIPVISWLVLRGRCTKCGTGISAMYPAVELIAGLGAAWSAWKFGFGLAAVGAMVFVWCTIALAIIDQRTGLLPDEITLSLLWFGILLNAWATFVPLQDAVIGAAGGYLFLWLVYWGFKLIFRKEGMGYGDFKMNAAVGAFLGWKLLPIVILISSIVGIVFGIAQMFVAKRGWQWGFKFHFGPYIAVAGIVAMFWGHDILARFSFFKIAG